MKITTLITYIFFCVLILITIACNGNKNAQNTCTIKAKVLDYSQLDGCQLLLETKEEKILMPFIISVPNKSIETLQNAQEVKIDYRVIEGVMSICMKGTPIEITCLKVVKEGKPEEVIIN